MQESEFIGQTASSIPFTDSQPSEMHRFERLKNDLIELEKRVQRSTDQSENEEVCFKPQCNLSKVS